MADSIVQGLFGVDPIQYQQQQRLLLDQQAQNFAAMSPMQRAQYGIFKGASQIGTGTGELLGIQDPALQKATMAKQLASQADTTTPDGLKKLAQAYVQAGMPDLAQRAIAAAQDMEIKSATVHAKMKEQLSPVAKAQNDRLRLLQAGYSPNSVEVQELTRYINSEGQGKAPQLSLNMKMFDAAAGRRDAFLKEVDPIIKQGNAINQALTLIDQGTPFSQAGFENKVVEAFGGDKQKSAKEINRLINTGGLETRIENSLRKFATGKISELTKEDQRNVLEGLQGGLKRQYNQKRDTIIKASSKVPELVGQEDFYAPQWEPSVGGGAARGRPAVSVGDTGKSQKYGNYTVTKVDQFGQPIEINAEKGGILTISGAK